MTQELAPDGTAKVRLKVTARRCLFALEYVRLSNGARAARRVGYSVSSAKVAAHRLLQRPDVQQMVKTHMAGKALVSMLDFFEYGDDFTFRWKKIDDLTASQRDRVAWFALDTDGRICELRLRDTGSEVEALGVVAGHA